MLFLFIHFSHFYTWWKVRKGRLNKHYAFMIGLPVFHSFFLLNFIHWHFDFLCTLYYFQLSEFCPPFFYTRSHLSFFLNAINIPLPLLLDLWYSFQVVCWNYGFTFIVVCFLRFFSSFFFSFLSPFRLLALLTSAWFFFFYFLSHSAIRMNDYFPHIFFFLSSSPLL